MQNNNSVEEERQEQCHVEENEFDMINHMHARPVHCKHSEEPMAATVYWPIRPTQKRCYLRAPHCGL